MRNYRCHVVTSRARRAYSAALLAATTHSLSTGNTSLSLPSALKRALLGCFATELMSRKKSQECFNLMSSTDLPRPSLMLCAFNLSYLHIFPPILNPEALKALQTDFEFLPLSSELRCLVAFT